MSYEGYYQVINKDGTQSHVDIWDDRDIPDNNTRWWRSVDTTNGYEEGVPQTYSAETMVTGTKDNWHLDVYGNKYCIQTSLVEPTDKSLWHEVKD